MLVTLVDFPIVLNDSSNLTFLEYLSRVSLISTILLKLPKGIVFDEKVTKLLHAIFSMGTCFCKGFTADDDDNVTKLLDNGLQVAYFTYSLDMPIEEKTLLKKVVKSLPRSRVGIHFSQSIHSDDANMAETVAFFSDVVSHFNFKHDPSCTNLEYQKILKKGKDLVNTANYAIQICFELPLGTSESVAVSTIFYCYFFCLALIVIYGFRHHLLHLWMVFM